MSGVTTDLAVVEAVVRRSGTSFYRGMRILPPERRHAMYAIYAFCRLVDDIADEPAPLAEKRAGLDGWRRRIAQLGDVAAEGAGEEGAVVRRLALAARQFDLRAADFQAVIDGMEMDAETVIVAPPFEVLDLYCDRVASAVGRLSVRAFGDGSDKADEVAHHLGRALQLTNILRDLGEDAARGRLYLAREWLAAHGVPAEPAAALAHPHLGRLCAEVSARARGHFEAAYAAMAFCSRRAMRPARLMAASYKAILDRLDQRGWAHPAQRVTVPKWAKLAIALRYAIG